MLRLSDLHVLVPSGVPPQQIQFELLEGQVGLVLGGAGTGKSAVIETIAVGDWPCLGKMSWRGLSLVDLSPPSRAKLGIGCVFQFPRTIQGLTVGDHIDLGRMQSLQNNRAKPVELFDIIPELLGLEDRYATQLSRRQRRLVDLARVLAGNPSFVLIDELTADIGVERMIELIDRLHDLGLTLLIADRYPAPLLPIADAGMVLVGGRMMLAGTAAELERDPRVVSVCVGDFTEGSIPSPT